MRAARYVLLLSLFFACFAGSASAQEQEGTVTGLITDGQGDPLPGAQVAIVGTTRGGATDTEGRYRLEHAPVGEQTLRASFVGYRPQTATVVVRTGQTAEQDFTLESDLLQMEEAVVTASFNPRAKIESSVAITTLSPQEIETRAPRSTADLLKAIPGFYVESSGGDVGNNLFARGIPQGGSYRYISLQEDGLPVYEAPELSFVNVDVFQRTDETVATLEAVRGGSASIFASNAPGGIINFVSKTGGEELGGLAKFTGGTSGLFRTDLNVGGPLLEGSDLWRFNIGGFYRYDEGVRYPGFAGNKGGQIKANVTRFLGEDGTAGYARVYGKYLNDRNIFYLPIPLTNPDDPEGLSGVDANYGTLAGQDASFIRVPSPDGREIVERDLTDGIHPIVGSLQGELVFDLGSNFTIENNARYMQADVEYNAVFSLGAPQTSENYAQSVLDSYNEDFEQDATGFRYDFTYDEDSTFDPDDANGNGLVVETGRWFIDKQLENFTNDLQLTFDVGEDAGYGGAHSVNAGVYFSEFSADELWHWNNILTEVADSPRLLDLTLTGEDGEEVVSATENGLRQYGTLYVNNHGQGTVIALYGGDEWAITDRFRLDLGARYEHAIFRGQVEGSETIDLGDPSTLADDNFATGTGRLEPYNHEFDMWAASLGANYRLSETLALFGRGSRGYRTPDFDRWRANPDDRGEVETIYQLEGGVKYFSENIGAFASFFLSSLRDIRFTDQVLNDAGEVVTLEQFASSLTYGGEFEVRAQYGAFRSSLTATIQQPEYRDYEFQEEGDEGQLVERDFTGNRLRRIPRFLIDFQPSYQLGPARVYGSVRYIDKRYTDASNNVDLPGYAVFNAGASFETGPVRVRIQGANLTNTIGLTEGNPRTGQVSGTEQQIYFARPILGRSANVSLTYNF